MSGTRLVARVPRASLEGGALVRVPYPPFDVLVAKVGDGYGAIEDACNHAGASLSEGDRVGDACVSCPMHGYVFSLTGGRLLRPRGLCDDQRAFQVTVERDDVLIWDEPVVSLIGV